MTSAWGTSWGGSWGDAWEAGVAPPEEIQAPLAVGYPARKKKRRRRQTIDKLLDHAIESTFEHFEARDDIKREIEAPKPIPAPTFEYPLPPSPEELAPLAAMQAELDRMRADLPAVARAIRQQREEEDIELLLMSL